MLAARHFNLWGICFTSIFSVFSVMAGWIVEILFMLFFACVTNVIKLHECEANWLISVPIINY